MILGKTPLDEIDLTQTFLDLTSEGKLESFLLIVPTNRRVRKLKKRLIDSSPSKTASVINLETLGTFAEKMLAERESFHNLTEYASAVFVEQAIGKTELNYFSAYKGESPFGTTQELCAVISEYKRYGIKPEDLEEEAKELNAAERRKALDIATVYREHLKTTRTLKAYELGDIYERLIEVWAEDFEKIFRSLYPSVRKIFIEGFDEFSPPEVEILNLISGITGTETFVSFDFYQYNPKIFSHLEECHKALISKGFREIKDKSPNENNGFVELVRRNLFLTENKRKIASFRNRIFEIGAESKSEEIRTIAKEIKRLILKEDVPPCEICLAFNSISEYSPIVRDVFNSYGIPFNLTDRITTDKTNPVTALINLLEIIENNFYYKNILRAFSSSFVRHEGIDVSSLQKAARELNIVAGWETWKNNLEIALEEGNEEKAYLQKALESLNKLGELLAPFRNSLTIDEFIAELTRLSLNVQQPFLLARGEDKRQEINIKSLSTLFEATHEVFLLLKSEEAEPLKHSLDFFLSRLRTIARTARFNVKERPDYGVLVTSVNEIRGLKFDYLFIGGMIDNGFPLRYKPEIFKPENFAKSEKIHMTEQRHLFYQAMKVWNKCLYFSYPKYEAKRELVTSVFLKEFKETFEVTPFSPEKLEDAFYSEEEIHKNFALISREGEIEKFFSDKNIKVDLDRIQRLLNIDKAKLKGSDEALEYFGVLLHEALENPSEELKEYLQNAPNRIYSVSQLESYAKCPFKYFLEKILEIKAIEEPREEAERREIGSFLHELFYEFYQTMNERKITLANSSDALFEEARKILFDMARAKLEGTPLKHPLSFYEKEKIIGINGKEEDSILYRFLLTERNDKSGFVPRYFEASFGMPKARNGSDFTVMTDEPLVIGGVKLRGKIDRIEINETEKKFNVVDYKLSGAKPSRAEIREGLALQLPVYLLAAEKLLKGKYAPEGMFIYSLKYSEDKFGKLTLITSHFLTPEEKKASLTPYDIISEVLNEKLNEYVTNISLGKFPVSNVKNRENTVCKYCDFRSVCRVDASALRNNTPTENT